MASLSASHAILRQLDAALQLVDALSSSLSIHQIMDVRQGLALSYETMGVILQLRRQAQEIIFARESSVRFLTPHSAPLVTANPDNVVAEGNNQNNTQPPVIRGGGQTARATRRRRRILAPGAATYRRRNGPSSDSLVTVISSDDSSAGERILFISPVHIHSNRLSRSMTRRCGRNHWPHFKRFGVTHFL
jgi:hypothetical protein